MNYLLRCIAVSTVIATNAVGQTPSKFDQCLKAIEKGDQESVISLAEIIKFKANPLPSDWANGEKCLEAAYGSNWAYDRLLKQWVEGQDAVKAEKRAEKEEAEGKLRSKQRCLTRKIKALENSKQLLSSYIKIENDTLIANSTASACNDLHEKDPNSAILNPICHEVFKSKTHPDLKLSDDGNLYLKINEEWITATIEQMEVENALATLNNGSKGTKPEKPNDLEIAFQSCD